MPLQTTTPPLFSTPADQPDPFAGLHLDEDQDGQLRVYARQLYADLQRLGTETKQDESLGRARYSGARTYFGMSEGVLLLAAKMLGDESILDNPDNL